MVQKKSLYIIESTSDTPTEKVRSGSTVRLSDGTNEWITLEDWSSGAFSDVEKYSEQEVTGVFQTSVSLGAGKAVNIEIGNYGTFSMLVTIGSKISGEYVTYIKNYIAAIGLNNKNVILSNGVIKTQLYESSISGLTVINTSNSLSDTDIKISIVSKDINFDSITVSDQYTDSSSIADEGINDEIAALQTKTTTNTASILSHASAIDTISSDVDYNTSNISANTSNISANTSNISANAASLLNKLESADLAALGVPLLVCNINVDSSGVVSLTDKSGIEASLWTAELSEYGDYYLVIYKSGSIELIKDYIVQFGTISTSDSQTITCATGAVTTVDRIMFKDDSGNNIASTAFSGNIPMTIYQK